MKKLLSLLTVSVLGVTSITNVAAFSQAKTTYKNINSGSATIRKIHLTIQLNASGWNHLLAYKSHFTINDKWGFGAYLLQYADDNEFHHTWGNFYMPDVPNAVKFQKSNVIENYFGHFGGVYDSKSSVAEHLFSNDGTSAKDIKTLYTLYNDLEDINITKGVIFKFAAGYTDITSIGISPHYYLLNDPISNIIK